METPVEPQSLSSGSVCRRCMHRQNRNGSGRSLPSWTASFPKPPVNIRRREPVSAKTLTTASRTRSDRTSPSGGRDGLSHANDTHCSSHITLLLYAYDRHGVTLSGKSCVPCANAVCYLFLDLRYRPRRESGALPPQDAKPSGDIRIIGQNAAGRVDGNLPFMAVAPLSSHWPPSPGHRSPNPHTTSIPGRRRARSARQIISWPDR